MVTYDSSTQVCELLTPEVFPSLAPGTCMDPIISILPASGVLFRQLGSCDDAESAAAALPQYEWGDLLWAYGRLDAVEGYQPVGWEENVRPGAGFYEGRWYPGKYDATTAGTWDNGIRFINLAGQAAFCGTGRHTLWLREDRSYDFILGFNPAADAFPDNAPIVSYGENGDGLVVVRSQTDGSWTWYSQGAATAKFYSATQNNVINEEATFDILILV